MLPIITSIDLCFICLVFRSVIAYGVDNRVSSFGKLNCILIWRALCILCIVMAKTNLALDKIVLLENDELESVIKYFKEDSSDKEKESSEEASRFYLNHLED
jgi:hypothetical protein